MCRVITITGGSSSGKDAILNAVLRANDEVQVIVSTTSRPMRIGEIDGVTYNFVLEEQAKKMLREGQFIENRIYKVATGEEWIYGITKDSIDIQSDNIYIVIVDFQGLKSLEEYLRQYDVDIRSIYIDCSAQERLRRSITREGKMSTEKVKEACRRLIADENEVVQAKDYCKYALGNETKNDFINNILFIDGIIKGEVL
jgi:guanylate kinase